MFGYLKKCQVALYLFQNISSCNSFYNLVKTNRVNVVVLGQLSDAENVVQTYIWSCRFVVQDVFDFRNQLQSFNIFFIFEVSLKTLITQQVTILSRVFKSICYLFVTNFRNLLDYFFEIRQINTVHILSFPLQELVVKSFSSFYFLLIKCFLNLLNDSIDMAPSV